MYENRPRILYDRILQTKRYKIMHLHKNMHLSLKYNLWYNWCQQIQNFIKQTLTHFQSTSWYSNYKQICISIKLRSLVIIIHIIFLIQIIYYLYEYLKLFSFYYTCKSVLRDNIKPREYYVRPTPVMVMIFIHVLYDVNSEWYTIRH